MPWKEHRPQDARVARDRPRVTLLKQRVLSLNAPAYELLGRPELVVLLYDEERNLVGIKPASAGDEHAIPVRQHSGSTGFRIAAKAFVRDFGIDVSKARTSVARLENGILVLDLNRAIGTAARAPKARPKVARLNRAS